MSTVGQVLFSFFEDHLKVQKGLRPGSIKSYRDTIKLFLAFVARACVTAHANLATATRVIQGQQTGRVPRWCRRNTPLVQGETEAL